jgi:hypothetical protein
MNLKKETSLSRIIHIAFVMLLGMAAVSSAATYVAWDNSELDGNWLNNANWDTGYYPPNNSSYYARCQLTTGPVITAGQTIAAYRLYLDGATNGTLTMDGGSLTLTNHLYCAAVSTDRGTLNMNNGTLTIGGTFYVARDAGSVAYLNLLGGTVDCVNFYPQSNTAGEMHINLEGNGKLIYTTLYNSATKPIETYRDNGTITAYNGAGEVKIDNTTIPGRTIISARPQNAAAVPVPDDGELNVPTNAHLSWKPLAGATSHDVYLGTSLTDVNNAARQLADLNGNTIVDWPDVSILTQHWLLDPAGTDPYAGVNDDSIVDLFDYSLLAEDWMSTANPIFKGNQDSNSFDPGTLAEGVIYYWRVDEVNGPNTFPGEVWRFTTQGFANVEKGPYLIYPGNNAQMTVLWQLDNTTTSSSIAWGTDTTYSAGSANTTEYGTDHQHKYTITGLTPGTKYYYRVTVCGVPYTGSFTAAPASDATSVKFFMYGDTRSNPSSHNSVCAGMNATYAADPAYQTIALHAGDWVSSDGETNWTSEWFTGTSSSTDIYSLIKNVPLAGCIGNHEGSATVWRKYWPFPFVSSRYFSFDYGPVHVAVVDQYTSYTSGSAQYSWLVSDLSNSSKPWKIIVLHQPGWACGGGHENDATVQSTIQPLCITYGVQIVLAGHVHYYSRAVVPAAPATPFVEHVTNGAGGAPAYTPNPGYPNIVTYSPGLAFCKVEINGNTLTCTTLRPDHVTVLDTFTLTK